MKMNYQEVNALLQGRNKDSKKVDNNTYWVRNGVDLCLKLHETNVVTLEPDGSIVLNSGGWKTPATKDRINNVVPRELMIYQNKSVWYVGQYIFEDGMRMDASGKIHATLASEAKEKSSDKWVKKVNDFAKEIVARAFDGRMPAPSGGDCWYCLMQTKEGKTMGDAFNDSGHIVDHIKEKYYVPSLFWNAMKENQDYLSTIARHCLAVINERQHNGSSEHKLMMEDTCKDQCYKAMRKYLRKRLSIAL